MLFVAIPPHSNNNQSNYKPQPPPQPQQHQNGFMPTRIKIHANPEKFLSGQEPRTRNIHLLGVCARFSSCPRTRVAPVSTAYLGARWWCCCARGEVICRSRLRLFVFRLLEVNYHHPSPSDSHFKRPKHLLMSF